MSFSLVYLISRFFWRIGEFIHHWYIHGSRNLSHFFISFLEKLDQTFALKITVQHFFRPLYKDYTVIGRVLGVIFRSGRIVVASIIYLFFSLIFLAIYLAWISFLPALIFLGASGIS